MNGIKQQILEILNNDCRVSLEQIATMIDRDITEVAQYIHELEKEQVILSYRPVINWDKAERQRVEAVIKVKVTPQRDFGFDAIAKRIYRFNEVKSLFLVSGNYDLLILVEAPTLKELAQFVSERLSPLETVTGTDTSFVLKRYKQDGVVFDDGGEDTRLVISP
ncbi:MAG: Lrp/AsnC family transcriptional regulator [Christensenellales bacterium]|jgi:DNA-binding Lrp family transcriptional regulator